MNGSSSFRLVLFVAINFLLNSPANAGLVKRSIRMVREVYPPDVEPDNESNQPQVCIVGDVVYGADETVPAEQPCLKCKCQPPGVVLCETVQCAKKPGCKAIHRPNRCCPDYQCECEHNGKIYANGEKLETNPGGECKVCYCRGGEVQCAEVSCYIRNDCEGKRVPGTCCPKYDHCPPIDAVLDRSIVITEPPVNTLKPVNLDLWQESNNATEPFVQPTLSTFSDDSNKVPDTSDLVTVAPSFQEVPAKEVNLHHRITIQEIIPERKEIPVTAPPKIFISEPQGTLLIEEALPTSENSVNDLNIDSEPESSEVSEVFQHPPPVLRVGDKLLILKKGGVLAENDTTTPDSVITIIGAEGLQRGGVEESLEVHEVKIIPQNALQSVSPLVVAENVTNDTTIKETEEDKSVDTNDLELKLSESTHILSLVKRKNKTTVTTTTTQAPTEDQESLTTLTSSIEQPHEDVSNKTVLEETTAALNDTKDTSETTTIVVATTSRNNEPAIIIEQNPAYPPIPDAMPSVGDTVINVQKTDSEAEKILPDVIELLNNQTRNETFNSEWLKINQSLIDFRAGALPEELLNQPSPIDEDNTTGTTEESTTVGLKDRTAADLVEEGPMLIAEVDISAPSTITKEETTTMLSLKSVESLEVDSGEQTTPKSNQSYPTPVLENISVEKVKDNLHLESVDMAQGAAKEPGIELGSVEIADRLPEVMPKDVEMIASSPKTSRGSDKYTTEDNLMKKEVELFNTLDTPEPTKPNKIPETSTYEFLPTPEANAKIVIKRQAGSSKSDDDVFKDLEKDLEVDSSFATQTSEDDHHRIFKELEEEVKGKSTQSKPKSKEQETIDSLSNALAGAALKGQIPDANVFRLIGGLFGGKRK
ncbi:bromodomain-containing protein DDB_G0270170 [Euwallacea fornicatus]|uniref:bromodomain-containing protein DDB_G0270170 n=1 Tax=Euwallacea fornicatus TaxID=995702 RepID=UPI00338EE187